MKRYLVVGSRDLTEYVNGQYLPLVVTRLIEKGHDVILFLLENGVIAGRKSSPSGQALTALVEKGARVYAEDLSCRARGIKNLNGGIALSSMDVLADLIVEGFDNIVWY